MEKTIKELRQKQQVTASKLNVLLFQTIFIFGVPAVFGYYTGLWLQGFQISKLIAFLLPLSISFLFSWFISIRKLKMLTSEIRNIEGQLQELHQKDTLKKEGEITEETG